MQGYWIKFTDGSAGYCQGQNPYDALRIAEHLTKKTAADTGPDKYKPQLKTLPYPANPVIWQLDHPIHGRTPNFCYQPEQCAGRTSCHQNRACTE